MPKSAPLILIVDDEETILELYAMTLEEAGFRVVKAESAEKAAVMIKNNIPDMIVSDVKMSGMDGISFLKQIKKEHPELPFLLITAYANIKDAVKSLKLGAVDYLEKPIDLDELCIAISNILSCDITDSFRDMPKNALKDIVAVSAEMQNLFADAYHVAKSKATVLLTGESGTGKEVLANFIHKNSLGQKHPFVAVNCASIPNALIASELFGYEKGAFTGAYSSRMGHFREADNGTLFLDEIGDMPLELQPALLRAIETNKILPVGGNTEISVNFRLVAATNKNLEQAVKNGKFREDLYYRLNVINFEVPSLKNHPEDIIPLTRHFLKQQSQLKKLASATCRSLQNYNWPGNIRELANAIERAVILSRTEMIMPQHLPPAIRNFTKTNPENNNLPLQTLEQVEIEMIKKTLTKTSGNQTRAAELLGISRKTLINKIKKFKKLFE